MPNTTLSSAASTLATALPPGSPRAPGPLIDPSRVLEPGFVEDTELGIAITTSLLPGLEKHAFAVVDLTPLPAGRPNFDKPRYFGINDTEQREIASLAKLLPLYATYDLRRNLQWFVDQLPSPPANIQTLAQMFRRSESIQSRATTIELDGQGNQFAHRPRIEPLFRLTSTGQVELRAGATDPVDPTNHRDVSEDVLDFISPEEDHPTSAIPRCNRLFGTACNECPPADCTLCHHSLYRDTTLDAEYRMSGVSDSLLKSEQRLATLEQLRLMGGRSDAIGAGVSINALGHNYMWALSKAAGLYRGSWAGVVTDHSSENRQGGFFLGADYICGGWRRRPHDAAAVAAFSQTTPRSATALSIATLMTSLATQTLGDTQLHAGMREILRRETYTDIHGHFAFSRGEKSQIGKGLGWNVAQDPWDYTLPAPVPSGDWAVSKVGLLNDPPAKRMASNALIISTERPTTAGSSKRITAVLVGIARNADALFVTGDADLKAFGSVMAVVFKNIHSLA